MYIRPLTKSYIESSVTVTEEGCWEWNKTKTAGGYGLLRRENKQILAHRLAYFLWNGKWPNICRHKCDNRPCCNPEHLEDGTHADNVRDRDERGRGRWATNEEHGRCKFSNEQVKWVREMWAAGMTQTAIGKEIGMSQTMVSRIVRNEHRLNY